jgi:hypothetical protein
MCWDGCWGGWMDAGMIVSVLGWLFDLFVHQMSFPKNEPFFRQTNPFPKKNLMRMIKPKQNFKAFQFKKIFLIVIKTI